MNKERRKAIDEAHGLVCSALHKLETAREDEQSAYDNMPEGLQRSDRGRDMAGGLRVLEREIERLEMISQELYELTN